jgi:hypothetical protein
MPAIKTKPTAEEKRLRKLYGANWRAVLASMDAYDDTDLTSDSFRSSEAPEPVSVRQGGMSSNGKKIRVNNADSRGYTSLTPDGKNGRR